MQDANLACPDLNGVVDKISHALQCLIAPHSSHIDFLLKVYLLLMHIVSGLGADERAFLDFPFDLAFAYLFQLLQLNRAFDHPECYYGLLSL